MRDPVNRPGRRVRDYLGFGGKAELDTASKTKRLGAAAVDAAPIIPVALVFGVAGGIGIAGSARFDDGPAPVFSVRRNCRPAADYGYCLQIRIRALAPGRAMIGEKLRGRWVARIDGAEDGAGAIIARQFLYLILVAIVLVNLGWP